MEMVFCPGCGGCGYGETEEQAWQGVSHDGGWHAQEGMTWDQVKNREWILDRDCEKDLARHRRSVDRLLASTCR